MKAKVDSSKCIGCGNCVALTEGRIFDFNEEGLAQVIVPEVSDELVDTVKDAISQCPTEAISEVKNEANPAPVEEKNEEENK